MPIPLFHVLCPKGETAYSVAGLSSQQMAALIPVCLSGIAARFSEKPSFPYLGLIYRSDSIQVYAFISCTGWTLLIGLDCGSFDADEVCIVVGFLLMLTVGGSFVFRKVVSCNSINGVEPVLQRFEIVRVVRSSDCKLNSVAFGHDDLHELIPSFRLESASFVCQLLLLPDDIFQ